MKSINRRQFIGQTTALTMAAGTLISHSIGAIGAGVVKRKMTLDLVCGCIGVSANQREAIDLAVRHGFESVEAQGGYLATLSDEQMAELAAYMKSKGIVFGAAGLPVEFRKDDSAFAADMKKLPAFAAGLKKAGVTRVSTWVMSFDGKLTYIQNFRQHAQRLREVAKTLNESGVRLGLEYLGPKTMWASQRYTFIHSMAEMKDLLSEIGTGNVGFLLDSWHWYNAEDTEADILSLKAEQVVAVDLNDAPADIPKAQQVDSRRELPCATGVIDVGAFLNALNKIGYDGPVRVEPFNEPLRKMPKEEACAATAAALKKAFDKII